MLHAVLVGVNEYADQDIPNLKCARADAERFASLLERRIQPGERSVRRLTDKEATLENVKIAIGEDLARAVKPDDMVLLYFACHGSREMIDAPDKLALYLALHNTQYDRIYATSVDMVRDIQTWIHRLSRAKLTVLILDACFSGEAGGRTFKSPRAPKIYRGADPVSLKTIDFGTGTMILSAAQGQQVAREDEKRGHGVFTYHLLNVLRRAPTEERASISAAMLYDELTRAVRRDTYGRQVPTLKCELVAAELPLLGPDDDDPTPPDNRAA
jgi:uncharacterized caspase-like protein